MAIILVCASICLMFCYSYVYDLESYLTVKVISLPRGSLEFMYMLASRPYFVVLLV